MTPHLVRAQSAYKDITEDTLISSNILSLSCLLYTSDAADER